MMNARSACAKWLAAVAVLTLARGAAAAALEVSTEDYPPFNFQKGEGGPIVGIATEILNAAAKSAGVDLRIALMPWPRAYGKGLNEAGNCVYSTTRTEEREPKFKWAGPLVQNDWVLFGRADGPKVSSLAEAKAYTVGGYAGDAATEYLKSQGLKVDEATADAVNPKKLMAKRIDFWVSGNALGPFLAAREGVKGVVPLFTIKKTAMYLACNKGVDDAIVAKLDKAIKKVFDDGTAAAIAKSYQ